MAATCRRVIIKQDPFLYLDSGKKIPHQGVWECKWVSCSPALKPPFVTAYRRRFQVRGTTCMRIHVSADERYELFLNGRRVGRGSEYGSGGNWFYETYELTLTPGEHVLVAKVWSLGLLAPAAQISLYPGFILAAAGAHGRLLGTGLADWEAKRIEGVAFRDSHQTPAFGVGAMLDIDGARFPWGFETGAGGGWAPVMALDNGANVLRRYTSAYRDGQYHLMRPALLPAMLEQDVQNGIVRFVGPGAAGENRQAAVTRRDHLEKEALQWSKLFQGEGTVRIPPNTVRRVILDLGNYYCAYPGLVTSGGRHSSIRVLWAEGLFMGTNDRPRQNSKGNRDEIEGKFFLGIGDTFRPDGGRRRLFEPLWWRAGRYVELLIQTAAEALIIERWALCETRYPLSLESEVNCGDARINNLIPLAVRSLQMCCHETYIDCPYYEQLMYAGDSRLKMLTTYVVTSDIRLPRKAIAMFDASRTGAGVVRAQYPSCLTQIIPSFALWWIGMVHDFAIWRDDPAFIKTMLPSVRALIEWMLTYRNQDGLIQNSDGIRQAYFGWNFIDWVTEWEDGVPPGGWYDVSAPINWHLALTLNTAAELEAAFGCRDRARLMQSLCADQAARAFRFFWDEERGMLADDPAKRHFSEHTQCLALLSGQVKPLYRNRIIKGLLTDPDLTRTTISYSHYLFETYRAIGAVSALFERLNLWFDLERQGLKTTPEQPEPTRSDCHGWSAHPMYHYFATILGIRPAGLGFNAVQIAPQLGPLTSAEGKLVHPKGVIDVRFNQDKKGLHGALRLPENVNGLFVYKNRRRRLKGGELYEF